MRTAILILFLQLMEGAFTQEPVYRGEQYYVAPIGRNPQETYKLLLRAKRDGRLNRVTANREKMVRIGRNQTMVRLYPRNSKPSIALVKIQKFNTPRP